MIDYIESATGVRFNVHIQPRARRTEIVGAHGSALKIRIQSPPVDGAANVALVAFVAEVLGVPRRDVEVVVGAGSRQKVVEVRGLTREAVARALAGLAP